MSLRSSSPPEKKVLPLGTSTSLMVGGAPRMSLIRTDVVVMCTDLVHVRPSSPHAMFLVVTVNESPVLDCFVFTRMYSQSPCMYTSQHDAIINVMRSEIAYLHFVVLFIASVHSRGFVVTNIMLASRRVCSAHVGGWFWSLTWPWCVLENEWMNEPMNER